MYAFVKVTGGPGSAFVALTKELGMTPRAMIEAMVLSFVADKNLPFPQPEDMGEGIDRLAATYQKMRATREALRREFEAEDKAIDAQMTQLANVLESNGVMP